jgi:hypothetical protein
MHETVWLNTSWPLEKTSHDLVNKWIPTFLRNLRLPFLDHPPDYTASHARSPSELHNLTSHMRQRKGTHVFTYSESNDWSEYGRRHGELVSIVATSAWSIRRYCQRTVTKHARGRAGPAACGGGGGCVVQTDQYTERGVAPCWSEV